MSYTKLQLIKTAFEELGLIDPDDNVLKPGQIDAAKKRADALAAAWANMDIHFPYPQSDDPDDSNVDMDSGVYQGMVRAFYKALAIEIAPIISYPVSRETKVAANEAFNQMLLNDGVLETRERSFPNTMPRGFGKKDWQGTGRTYYEGNEGHY